MGSRDHDIPYQSVGPERSDEWTSTILVEEGISGKDKDQAIKKRRSKSFSICLRVLRPGPASKLLLHRRFQRQGSKYFSQ